MFFGRKEMLERFASLWQKRVPSLVVCRGRRRIGKSTLIKTFAQESGGLFLKFEGLAPDANMTNAKQLDEFRNQLHVQTGRKIPRLRDWSAAFRELDVSLKVSGRKIVLFDEISWMGGADTTYPAKLKIAWDNLFHEHEELIVFVCGSVSAWIRKNILKSHGFVGRISLDTVVPELPLKDCVKFWGHVKSRLAPREILDVLSITGGVPRYLEEIDPRVSADENIRRLCFSSDGYLYREFTELFNDVISRTASLKRRLLISLAEGAASVEELSQKLALTRSGHLSSILGELETAGFVTKSVGLNPATGRRSRVDQFRIRDNYVRFFLRYVEPRLPEIAAGTFTFVSVSLLPGWNAMMGLQFENLVLANRVALFPLLNLQGKLILSAEPYRNRRTSRGGGVQIDLLIQTEGTVWIVEIKRQATLGIEIAEAIREKAARLPFRRNVSVRTALVYDGTLSPSLQSSDDVDVFVSSRQLLGIDTVEGVA